MGWFQKAVAKAKGWVHSLRRMTKRSRRRIYLTVICLFLIWANFQWLTPGPSPVVENNEPKPVSYSTLLDMVEHDEVAMVNMAADSLTAHLKNGYKVTTHVLSAFASPIPELRAHHVTISFSADESPRPPRDATPLVFILILGIWFYFFLWGIGPTGEVRIPFRKRIDPDTGKRITFADVAGVDEAKEDLREIVELLRHPGDYEGGGRVPRGALLVGPPGTGKTLLARAVAGEANVPFFQMAGPEFVEMYVGVGASRMRRFFDKAKSHAPCIIYIDEIDSVGAKRMPIQSGGDREYQQTTNQLLVELDGFEKHHGIVFLASTNRPEHLDEALLRPGRFDRQIVVPPPDVRGREEILKVHARKHKLDNDVDFAMIALGTPGFTGADLANLVNEAWLASKREHPPAKKTAMRHFLSAKDKVLMGSERKSLVLTETDKARTAYHELGHALVAMKTPGADPVEKVSIMPRGRALGVTIQLPPADRHHYTKRFLIARLAVMMGGRAAEELFFGEDVSGGAESDIEEATKLATYMVCRWGMSSEVGPFALRKSGGAFLGGSGNYDCSPQLAFRADEEIKSLLMTALEAARSILEREYDGLERAARILLMRTELTGKEIEELLVKSSRT